MSRALRFTRSRSLLALLVLVCCAWSSAAAAASLVLQADTKRPELGAPFALNLTLVDGRVSGDPSPPNIPGLQLALRGTKQSSVFIQGRATRTLTWSYVATPLIEGVIEIPAWELEVGGEPVRSQALRVEVQPKVDVDGDSAISATLSATEAWVGQVLVYHLDFRTRLRVLDLNWTPPPLEGLINEQNTSSQSSERRTAIDGEAWSITELDLPLVAVGAGARSVSPSVLTAEIPARTTNQTRGPMGLRGFSNVKREVFTTKPIPLVVRELPEAGRSEHWSGLVGTFSLDVSLSDARVALGESTTLEVRLSGDGTLSGFALPAAPDDAGYRAYDDDPEVQTALQASAFRAEGTWRRAIVPEREGAIDLGEVVIQVFDPARGDFVELRSGPLRLEVSAGEQRDGVSSFADAQLDGRRDVAALGDDILPVHPRASAGSQLFQPGAAIALGGAPWILLAALWLRGAWGARVRVVDPRATLSARLASAQSADLGQLEDLLRDALAVRIGRPAAGLDREVISAQLSGPLREEALSVYDDLSAARYGGGVDAGLRERVLRLATTLVEETP